MLRGSAVTKAFADTILLDKVDLLVGEGNKIGLVGRNGCGKTTLLKLLVGEEEVSAGFIDRANAKLAYIPQEFSFPDRLVGEYLLAHLTDAREFYRVEQFAAKLAFTEFDPKQRLVTLSEGQKMKVKLIEALLAEPSTLLIDEPTNHLDIEGIMWFEDYVRSLTISVLMISHDRSFLNHTVDEIWEIDKLKLFRYVGDYDNYKSEKLKLINRWDTEYKLFVKNKSHLDKLLANARKIKDAKKRGNAVHAAKKRIEREVTNDPKEKYTVTNINTIEFATTVRSGKLMLRCAGLTKVYNGKEVLANVNLELRGNDKIWLFGPNGAGKSTLLKLVIGEETPTQGVAEVGPNLRVGYFSQVQTELCFTETVLESFIRETGCYFGTAYGKLNKFLFSKEAVCKRLWQLSPGERSRYKLAVFAAKTYDLLIMDEPDNHLDIETKEVLEESLREYKGALLLVSHDRYFVERIGIEKLYNLREGVLAYLNA
jgi:ATPase subunit of ABC transporter with duplicated ATPase domains